MQQRLSDVGLRSGDEVSRTRADLQLAISQLVSQMQRIEGQLESMQMRLGDLDRQIGQLRSRNPSPKASAGDTSTRAAGSPLETSLQTANEDFARGRFDLAFRGFSEVVARDSSGTLAPQALLRMAECRYAQNNWDEARTLFQKLLRDYSKDPARCPAMFKLGLVHERLGSVPDRDETWNRLQKSCPGSNEAQRAKDIQSAK